VNPPTLADPTAQSEPGQAPDAAGEQATQGAGAGPQTEGTQSSATRACSNCGAALAPGQDWCLECGAGAPGSLEAGGPGWRSATIVLAATGVLVLGAAAAGYAALSQKSPPKAAPKVITVARTIPAPASPTTSTPGLSTPQTPTPNAGLGSPSTSTPGIVAKAPKIPLTAPTPKPARVAPKPGAGLLGGLGALKRKGKSGGGASGGSSGGTQTTPSPILLDTDAASTYNPYSYPESEFGDPRLATDGETGTGWTATVQPAVAPKMAVGLMIDLKAPQRVGSLTMISSTPGMTVQVYGANGEAPPTSITDPAWTALSPPFDAKKHKTQLKLRNSQRAFRFVVVWINQAPASAVGTPQAPGHVAIDELELFPPK
jgi:hypothetical protein